jgi:transmembrane sensor
MNEPRPDPERDPVYAAAADWLSRLQQPSLTLQETLDWQKWMAQSPRHSEAFREIEELWERFGSLGPPQPVAPDTLCGDRYDGSVAVSTWKAQLGITPRRSLRARALAAMLLIALIGAGFGSYWLPPMLERLSNAGTFETAVGKNANVRLADGSVVRLGGHTRLRVTLTQHLRQVDLLRGEACFEVAKDSTRPFLVRAGTATVTAVGTEFNIRRSDDRVVVSVLEGRILVQPMTPVIPINWVPITKAFGTPTQVKAGERTTIDSRGIESTQAVSDASSAVAWQHGRLAFESEPLRYVLQDVNRYAEKPIIIADPSMAELRVTGTVTEANIIGWVRSLHNAFGLHADIESDRIVLRPD